ncbi:MAG: hypothetical protein HOQ32_17830 [Lysobacter sp.]|nr:hypothetical protein [Lysobacter sp.]
MHRFEAPEEFEPQFRHLVIINSAIFVLRFVIQRLVDDRLVSQTNSLGRLSLGRSRSIDLTTLHFHGERLQEGDHVRLRVGAVGGVRRNGPSVAFTRFGRPTVHFDVRGMTGGFSIHHAPPGMSALR